MTPRGWPSTTARASRSARPCDRGRLSVALYVAATGERLFAGGVASALTAMNPRRS